MTTTEKLNNGYEKNKPEVRLLERHALTTDNRYSRCYKCWKEGKRQGKTNEVLLQDIPKLIYIKTMEIYKLPKGIYKSVEENYKCTKCGGTFCVEDFEKNYCAPYTDGGK